MLTIVPISSFNLDQPRLLVLGPFLCCTDAELSPLPRLVLFAVPDSKES